MNESIRSGENFNALKEGSASNDPRSYAIAAERAMVDI